MIKHITIPVAFLMTISTQASADEMTYSDLKNLKVNVFLYDDAKDACWTNLTESREYAEEKLRSAGATVVPLSSVPDYLMIVKVTSRRNKAVKLCYGSISIDLDTPITLNGRDHAATAITYEAIFMGMQNINTGIIESTQAFFDQFSAR